MGRQTVDARAVKQSALRLAQDNRHLSRPPRQALARAKQERNAFPTRVVDPCPHRYERLDGRLGSDQFLVVISGDLLSLDNACCVLALDEVVRGEWAYRLEQFSLAVADVLRSKRVGRLHRHEREHLEQVVLDHVAQRARLLVLAPAPGDAVGLSDCDLNVIDRLAAPRSLDHRVGKPKTRMFCTASLPT
jgi:hypothetical protein